jgi:flagellum-specific peptidoglycan hydrolase FlgJ
MTTAREKREMVEKFAKAAQAAQAEHDVPASVLLAQALLEGGWFTRNFKRQAKRFAELEQYQPAMAVADDPLAFAIQLQRCGYSEDRNYPTKLARLMAQFKLARYDAPQEA